MPKTRKKSRARTKGRYSATARRFVSSEIRKLIARGFDQARAIDAALSSARKKGYKVPAAQNVAWWALGAPSSKRKRKTRAKKTKSSKSSTRRRSARANPAGVVIGDSALALQYEGGEGKRKGKMRGPWKHEFESDDIQVIGRKDGSVLLKSKSGEKLWGHFEV